MGSLMKGNEERRLEEGKKRKRKKDMKHREREREKRKNREREKWNSSHKRRKGGTKIEGKNQKKKGRKNLIGKKKKTVELSKGGSNGPRRLCWKDPSNKE